MRAHQQSSSAFRQPRPFARATTVRLYCAALLLVLFSLPLDAFAQSRVDCSKLHMGIEATDIMAQGGIACKAVDGKNGRVEMLMASGAGLSSVTTLVHLEDSRGTIKPNKIEDFIDWTGAFETTTGWTAPTSRGGFTVRSFNGQLQVKPGWKARCISYTRYSGGTGSSGLYRHQLSGFTCYEDLGPSSEWTDQLIDDLLRRVKYDF